MTVEKVITNTATNQSEFIAVACNLLKSTKKKKKNSGVRGAIGISFATNWLKNWGEIF